MSAPVSAPERSLDALYAELPSLECQGLCQNSCGPIVMSRVEWDRIRKRVGHEPKANSLTCPLLTNTGRCKVYGARPMICRLWGLVESMPCVYGCKPDRYLTDEEGGEFLRRAAEVGG